jgi:DNA polymerase-3 subunit alpha
LTKRVSGKAVNKRCLESMAQAGAFDCFPDAHRAQYFFIDPRDGMSGLEKAARFGNASATQANSLQASLFGDVMVEEVSQPTLAKCEPWSKLEALSKEKEVIGFYISGHPLDDYKFELKNFCSAKIDQLTSQESLKALRGRDLSFAGIITAVNHRMSKTGKPFGSFMIEDLSGNMEIALFGEDYGKLKQFLEPESLVYIKAKVQNRFKKEDEFELKPYAVQYLSDIGDKLTKELVVHLKLWELNGDVGQQLMSLLSQHQGNTPVRIKVYDEEKRWHLPFQVKSLKVNINSNLIQEVTRITGGEITMA